MLEKGTTLNNIYKVIKLLGKGGMGNVYLVERKNDSQRFVVKELIFKENLGLDMESAKEIFFREAEFIAKFNHPGLPKMYGIFSQDGNEYLTMEYIEGETLEEIINKTPKSGINREQVIKWTIELAEIISYLHNSFHTPIVYRDLKPSNIIITHNMKVKLVDFGIARYYNPDKNTDTFSYGSPGYAAPEQYRGKGQSSPQSDVFGLGVILFQMLTKFDPTIKPFTFPPMKSLNPLISQELEKIVRRAIELDPIKRYISAEEFKETLEKHIGIKKSLPKKSYSPPAPNNIFYIIGIIICAAMIAGGVFGGIPGALVGLVLALYLIVVIALFYGLAYGFLSFFYWIGQVITGKKYKVNNVLGIILAILLAFFIFRYFAINFKQARSSGQLAACESSLKNTATALEMYSTDEIYYPPSIDFLTRGKNPYMRNLPSCPSCNKPYGYKVSSDGKDYTLWCGQEKAHEYSGINENGCWPQYSPKKGLMTKSNE